VQAALRAPGDLNDARVLAGLAGREAGQAAFCWEAATLD